MNVSSAAQPKAKTVDAGQTRSVLIRAKSTRVRHFVRHLVEMILAMMIGMAALGALWRAILAAVDVDASDFRLRHAAVVALVMAFDMTVPMVWWMRHRGHNWARGAEMAGAMFVPTLFLIGLLQLGAVSGESLIGLEHALMLPAMLLVMFWRLDEYTRPHARVASRAPSGGRTRAFSGTIDESGTSPAAVLLERRQ